MDQPRVVAVAHHLFDETESLDQEHPFIGYDRKVLHPSRGQPTSGRQTRWTTGLLGGQGR
jgi:hypothetical protein